MHILHTDPQIHFLTKNKEVTESTFWIEIEPLTLCVGHLAKMMNFDKLLLQFYPSGKVTNFF